MFLCPHDKKRFDPMRELQSIGTREQTYGCSDIVYATTQKGQYQKHNAVAIRYWQITWNVRE